MTVFFLIFLITLALFVPKIYCDFYDQPYGSFGLMDNGYQFEGMSNSRRGGMGMPCGFLCEVLNAI